MASQLLKTTLPLMCLLVGCVQLPERSQDTARPTASQDLAGAEQRLGEGRQLLVFWQPTCDSCRRHNPELIALWEARHHDLEVIGICVSKKTPEVVRQTAEEWGIPFATVHDPELQISRHFGVSGTPTLILFDKGQEIFRDHRLPEDFDQLLPPAPSHAGGAPSADFTFCQNCLGSGCADCDHIGYLSHATADENAQCQDGVCRIEP